jgi:hypothetical protein
MKKTLLLSVVASTMIMAGGDIAPVEPVEAAPAASAWEFSGNAVGYYQTVGDDTLDIFDTENSFGNTGAQLRATNADLVAGIGAGIEVTGLAELPFVADNYAQSPVGELNHAGGWISQAYLTYGFGNTSIKVGRQELPKALSPFAFSENWNVFKNTFDAALLVNTDITDTAIVYAFVDSANFNMSFGSSPMNQFNDLNQDDGVHMLTVQNKSIADLTLTGSFYHGTEHIGGEDTQILWGDAAYNAGNFGVAIQGGTVMNDSLVDDITSFGAKIDGAVSGINLMAAYSTVEEGAMFQLGGMTSALYTTMVGNQLFNGAFEINADKFVVGAGIDALGGNISAAYGMADSDITGDANEFDLVYATNLTDSVDLSAAYVNYDQDWATDSWDIVRVIANYKF